MTNPSFFEWALRGYEISFIINHYPEETDMRQAVLKKMMGAIAHTLPDEIGCDECFALSDQLAELVLNCKPAADLMPLVHAHLERCPDCKEKFEAFLVTLRLTS